MGTEALTPALLPAGSIPWPGLRRPERGGLWAVVGSVLLHAALLWLVPQLDLPASAPVPERTLLLVSWAAASAAVPSSAPAPREATPPKSVSPRNVTHATSAPSERLSLPAPRAAAITTQATPITATAPQPRATSAAPALAAPAPTHTAPVLTAAAPSAPVTPSAPATPTAARPDPGSLDRYGRALAEQLAQQQHYPRLAALRGWEGEVRVQVRIARKGGIVAVALDRSSGFAVLDQQALQLVQGTVPPPLPAGLEASEIELVVPIHFRLNRQG